MTLGVKFSALITGKAIVHTTGMPVVYSFELVGVHPERRQPVSFMILT